MAGGDHSRACAHCGGTIAPRINKTGRPSKAPRKFCNRRCHEAWHHVRRGPGRQRNSKPKGMICIGCHREVVRLVRGGRSDAGKFCTRECAVRHRSLVAGEMLALKRMATRQAQSERKRAAAEKVPAVDVVSCCMCSASMVRPKNGWASRSCCSDACRKARLASRKRRALTSEAGKASKRRAKAKRRAVERGARADNIDPIAVFDRDGWKCQLCGERTPRRLRGTTQDRAPELDHVLPLALGGQHTWGNVQCACRACNLAKGATPLGQMGLPIAA